MKRKILETLYLFIFGVGRGLAAKNKNAGEHCGDLFKRRACGALSKKWRAAPDFHELQKLFCCLLCSQY